MKAAADMEYISIDLDRQDIVINIEEVISTFKKEVLSLDSILDFPMILHEKCKQIVDSIWKYFLSLLLENKTFLMMLRIIGGQKGMRCVSYQVITITLPTGTKCCIRSPFFIKVKKRRGPKKRGPQNRGSHLGLKILGFVGMTACSLALRAIQLALISSSFEVASKILQSEGIKMCPKVIKSLILKFAPENNDQRVDRLFDKDRDLLVGQRVMILIDGGRLRQRKQKRGKIPEGQKLHGFHTDWIEPKLLEILVLDQNGNPLKSFAPIVDGATKKLPAFLKLLEKYLIKLQVNTSSEVVLCGDGAPWIWERVPALLEKVGVDPQKITQVIDWTHAKQNLMEAFMLIPRKRRKVSGIGFNDIKNLLFSGSIDELVMKVKTEFKLRSSSKAIKKLNSYFLKNRDRMKYQEFENRKVPIGSGAIESAIRRVINLRLKAPGSFWNLEFAEKMIYLRAQLLYGRWGNLVKNYMKEFRQLAAACVFQLIPGSLDKI